MRGDRLRIVMGAISFSSLFLVAALESCDKRHPQTVQSDCQKTGGTEYYSTKGEKLCVVRSNPR